MGQLFAKSAPKSNVQTDKRTVSDKDKAVLKLKRARDRLTKFQKKTDIDSVKLQNQAKEFIQNGRKDRAMMALKIRKLKLKEVASVDAKLMDVVRMIEEIEWESQNVEVLLALEAGTAALDQLHREMPVEEVERILQESAESIEMQNEICSMLSADNFTEQDESELEAQLEALGEEEEGEKVKKKEAEVKKNEVKKNKVKKNEVKDKVEEDKVEEVAVDVNHLRFPEVPTTPVFPAVPTHQPVVEEKQERDAREGRVPA